MLAGHLRRVLRKVTLYVWHFEKLRCALVLRKVTLHIAFAEVISLTVHLWYPVTACKVPITSKF